MKAIDFTEYEFTIYPPDDEEPVVMFRNKAYPIERAALLTSCGIPRTPDDIGWPDDENEQLISALKRKYPRYGFENMAENQYDFHDLWSVVDDLESLGMKYVEIKYA